MMELVKEGFERDLEIMRSYDKRIVKLEKTVALYHDIYLECMTELMKCEETTNKIKIESDIKKEDIRRLFIMLKTNRDMIFDLRSSLDKHRHRPWWRRFIGINWKKG